MEHHLKDAGDQNVHSRKNSWSIKSNGAQGHVRRQTSRLDDVPLTPVSFDAVTISATNSYRTFTFIPISTVLRAHIPLSWLAVSTANHLPFGSLLCAKISSVSRWEYSVLIAKLVSSHALFAFEKVEDDTFICCPLQNWVTPQWVEKASFGAAPLVDLALLRKPPDGCGHSRKPSGTGTPDATDGFVVPPSPKMPSNRRGQLARLSILESREKTEEPSSAIDEESHRNSETPGNHNSRLEATPDVTESITNDSHIILPDVTEEPKPLTPLVLGINDSMSVLMPEERIIPIDHLSADHLRRQYLETLYVSKTSLAYYAKGPLSRARARARAPGASRSSAALADFYRESILSSKKLDLKYKESIHNKIKNIPAYESGDANEASSKKRNRRTKLDKDGFWPIEDEYFMRWWKDQVSAPGLLHSIAIQADLRKAISQLRMRETELQIVLMLEVLALEVRDVQKQVSDAKAEDFAIKIESEEKDGVVPLSNRSAGKKKRDLKSELELLVDRLCIWHSIGFDESSSATNTLQNSDSSSQKVKDRLRDFCKDVIVPFYAAKLPDECQSICAKMGGPEVSPRRKQSVGVWQNNSQAPGSMLVNQTAARKRHLERLLSDDQGIRHASPPTLVRSTTLPAQMSSKREPSERPISRSGLQKSVSFTNREVDLVADAKATAVKRRKLDMVVAQKRELDAAIETLKRPNRSIVAKSFMDDVERRSTSLNPAVKKVEPVQISATPRHNRTRPYQPDDYDLPPMSIATIPHTEHVVLSSTSKPRGLSQLTSMPRSSAKKRAVLSAIYDTPSRRTLNKGQELQLDGQADFTGNTSIDTTSNSARIASTPAASRLRIDLTEQIAVTPMRMTKSLKPVLLTPMEKSEADIDQMFRDAPEIPERAGKTMDRVMGSKSDAAGVSLYDSLGWNDDYDL